MPKTIPERDPIGDLFAGIVVQVKGHHALALEPQSGADVLASGSLMVRYGVRYLEKPHFSIVPGIVVLDYGDMLTGEAAWDFLHRRSNLHPRAEVVGYRSDGRDEMVFVRQLDLALAVQPLVYADANATMPVARPVALLAANITGIAPRILHYLPAFPTLAAWQAETAS